MKSQVLIVVNPVKQSSDENRQRNIQLIVGYLKGDGWDGVNINFKMVAFITLVREK